MKNQKRGSTHPFVRGIVTAALTGWLYIPMLILGCLLAIAVPNQSLTIWVWKLVAYLDSDADRDRKYGLGYYFGILAQELAIGVVAALLLSSYSLLR